MLVIGRRSRCSELLSRRLWHHLHTASESIAESAGSADSKFVTKLLYEGSHSFQIRVMLGMGALNSVYWTGYLANTYFNFGVVVQGVDLGGSLWLGGVGLVGTGLIFYSTHVYATRACCVAWESADGLRLGFQLHTNTGGRGRKIEVPKADARLVNYSLANKTMLLPVRIKGLGKNIVLDRSGRFLEDKLLLEVLVDNAKQQDNAGNASPITQLDSKARRIDWLHSAGKRERGRRAQSGGSAARSLCCSAQVLA